MTTELKKSLQSLKDKHNVLNGNIDVLKEDTGKGMNSMHKKIEENRNENHDTFVDKVTYEVTTRELEKQLAIHVESLKAEI